MMSTTTTKPKFFCFVLMPFDDQFMDVYQLGIKQACIDAGTYCERVDEQIFQERILDRIYNQIAKADLVIADMTGRNPNVFYEVGYAHALGKATVLLTRAAEDIPFDLKHFPHIVYGGKIAQLKIDLSERIRWFEGNVGQLNRGEFPIEIFLDQVDLASGEARITTHPLSYPEILLTVRNRSGRTLHASEFKVGVVTPATFPGCRSEYVSTTKLPDGHFLHVLTTDESLFPQEAMTCRFILEMVELQYPPTEVAVRVFTDAGARDFSLTLERAKQA